MSALKSRSARMAVAPMLLIALGVGIQDLSAETVDLLIDTSRSSVEVGVSGDSDSSTISGTAAIDLVPPVEPFGMAQLTQLHAIIDDGISLSFAGGLVTATIAPGQGSMILVAPGPAGAVNGDSQFDQLNNEIGFTGSLNIVDPFNLAGGSRSIDLSTLDNSVVDLLAVQLSVAGNFLTVDADFNIELTLDNGLVLTAVGSIVSTGELPPPPVVVAPFELTVTQGLQSGGSVVELLESDDADLSIRRDPSSLNAITEFEIKGISPIFSPARFEFTLEASVFARTAVTQRIFVFNFADNRYEDLDLRAAQRMSDLTVVVKPTGDLSRFVQAGTGCVVGKIRFRSANQRQSFSANIDQAIWTVGQ